MKQAIVVGTRPDRKEQLKNCLNSLNTSYDVLVADCDGYEVGKLKWVLEKTDIDEFIFLQDTIEVKDPRFIDICFALPQSVSIMNYPSFFGSYCGKFKRSVLEQINLPDIKNKYQAVDYEQNFGSIYAKIEEPFVLFEDMGKRSRDFVEKFGKTQMICENDYFIKYKSVWHRNMITDDM